MALKTFNVDDVTYKTYSKHCKKKGISMSRQIENFLKEEVKKLGKIGLEIDSGMKEMVKKMEGTEKTMEHPLRKYC